MGDPGRLVRAVVMGLAAGVLAGMFGIGGGIIMVPLLVAWFALDQRHASATSLLAIVPIGIASAWGYAINGNVAWADAALLALGSVAGGQLGTWLLPRTPIRRLQLWFGFLSIVTAIRLVLEESGGAAAAGHAGTTPAEAALLVVVGLAGGILAGLLGVGGGVIMVPALVILVGADADVARGTSLAVLVVTAVTATIANISRDMVEIRTSLVAGFSGIPGGLAGAWLGQQIGGRVALTLFAGLLVWSGVRMIRRPRTGPPPAPA